MPSASWICYNKGQGQRLSQTQHLVVLLQHDPHIGVPVASEKHRKRCAPAVRHRASRSLKRPNFAAETQLKDSPS